MADGILRIQQVEAYRAETANGIAKTLTCCPGTARDQVLIGVATKSCAGVVLDGTDTTNGVFSVQVEGVCKVQAAGAVTAVSSGVCTTVYMAASGQVQALPATAGTYYPVGRCHPTSANADGAGDILTVVLTPGAAPVVVPSAAFAGIDCIHFDLPGDLAAGATGEVFLFEVPSGLVFTITRFDIWNTDVGTGATADPEISGTDIMAAPQALSDNAQTEILAASLTDTTVAAGEILSIEFAAAADTGALKGCHGCVTGVWSAA